jgi:prepilin-type N-terminal cleavage/methylation domain-containing protein
MRNPMATLSREDGFTITEMMVSTAVVLLVLAGALTTFRNALAINDSAAQLADANQNLRAGTNQLIRDLLMAGRIIGTEGIAMPTGPGITYARPGPVNLNFDVVADANGDSTVQLPAISTGFQLGPVINGSPTDIITILTVDEFMPVVATPPLDAVAGPTAAEGTISADGTYVQFAAASLWIDGDTSGDTPKIAVGDLVLYVGTQGNAIQTVTSIDRTAHRIYFASNNANDYFHFNQPNATAPLCAAQPCPTGRPLGAMKNKPLATDLWTAPDVKVTLFKALMITYYVDNTTTIGTPRLTRQINSCPTGWVRPAPCAFAPQALAGVVEDLDLTYDLYDGNVNPVALQWLPQTINGQLYTDNQIRKVNIHVGVRSETISKPTQDYVRNHITTSVNVRSLTAVDKYPS